MLIFCLCLFLGCEIDKNKEIKANHKTIKEAYKKNLKDSSLITGWYHIANTNCFFKYFEKTDKKYCINPNPIITDAYFEKIKIMNSIKGIDIFLNKKGTKIWSEATKESIGKNFAFIIEDQLVGIVKVNEQITFGRASFSTGKYSKKELKKFIDQIRN